MNHTNHLTDADRAYFRHEVAQAAKLFQIPRESVTFDHLHALETYQARWENRMFEREIWDADLANYI